MKHAKLKILLAILLSNIVLIITFLCFFTYALPGYFENEAAMALENEMTYVSSDMSDYEFEDEFDDDFYEDFEDEFDEEYDEMLYADESYMSSAICFFFPGDESVPVAGADRDIREYCQKNMLEDGECYSFVTGRGHYVLIKYTDPDDLDDGMAETVMYINIQPFIEYIPWLSAIVVIVFICETAVMCFVGYRLGMNIEKAHETQRIFFQNSSHELKTPLMSIQGYAEGIQTGLMDTAHASGIIVSESERMARLVDEILYISKIDAKMLKPEMARTDIREVLYECIRSVEPLAAETDKKVEPLFPEKPVSVLCDEEQLIRAFRNILVNGIRHGSSCVRIRLEADEKECRVYFADDGNGIDEKDAPHIFDRFYTGSGGSTGIGLALAKEIVTLHHGCITAYNGETGAVFEIKLPLA